MPFAKCKVYFDGSHYIAISPTTQKRRGRVGVRAVSEEDEDIVAETKQLGLFDENTADEKERTAQRTRERLRRIKRKRATAQRLRRKERYLSACIKSR